MYANHLIVNSPTMASGQNRCKECHMTFNSQRLLTKHKSKFCVGGTGDPDDLMLRRGLRSAGDTPPRIDSPDSRPETGDVVINKVDQLRRMKAKRARQQDLQDLEERMLLDKLEDTDMMVYGSPSQPNRNQLPLSNDIDVRELQLERQPEVPKHTSTPKAIRDHKVLRKEMTSAKSASANDPRQNPTLRNKMKVASSQGSQLSRDLHLSGLSGTVSRQSKETLRNVSQSARGKDSPLSRELLSGMSGRDSRQSKEFHRSKMKSASGQNRQATFNRTPQHKVNEPKSAWKDSLASEWDEEMDTGEINTNQSRLKKEFDKDKEAFVDTLDEVLKQRLTIDREMWKQQMEQERGMWQKQMKQQETAKSHDMDIKILQERERIRQKMQEDFNEKQIRLEKQFEEDMAEQLSILKRQYEDEFSQKQFKIKHEIEEEITKKQDTMKQLGDDQLATRHDEVSKQLEAEYNAKLQDEMFQFKLKLENDAKNKYNNLKLELENEAQKNSEAEKISIQMTYEKEYSEKLKAEEEKWKTHYEQELNKQLEQAEEHWKARSDHDIDSKVREASEKWTSMNTENLERRLEEERLKWQEIWSEKKDSEIEVIKAEAEDKMKLDTAREMDKFRGDWKHLFETELSDKLQRQEQMWKNMIEKDIENKIELERGKWSTLKGSELETKLSQEKLTLERRLNQKTAEEMRSMTDQTQAKLKQDMFKEMETFKGHWRQLLEREMNEKMILQEQMWRNIIQKDIEKKLVIERERWTKMKEISFEKKLAEEKVKLQNMWDEKKKVEMWLLKNKENENMIVDVKDEVDQFKGDWRMLYEEEVNGRLGKIEDKWEDMMTKDIDMRLKYERSKWQEIKNIEWESKLEEKKQVWHQEWEKKKKVEQEQLKKQLEANLRTDLDLEMEQYREEVVAEFQHRLHVQYERLRQKETEIKRKPELKHKLEANRKPGHGQTSRQTPYSRNSNSYSVSIHLDDDYRRYNPNADQQFRSLAENHGKQMEYLQLRNRDLEQQREDIRKRLEDLGKKPVQPERDTTTQLLQELKDQEERNQRSLEDLKRQLYDINSNQRVNVIDLELLSRNMGKSIVKLTEVQRRVEELGIDGPAIPGGKEKDTVNNKGTAVNTKNATAADAGIHEAGIPEAGIPEAGIPDTGIPEAGIYEAGIPEAGIHESGIPEAETGSKSQGDLATSDPFHGLPATLDSVLSESSTGQATYEELQRKVQHKQQLVNALKDQLDISGGLFRKKAGHKSVFIPPDDELVPPPEPAPTFPRKYRNHENRSIALVDELSERPVYMPPPPQPTPAPAPPPPKTPPEPKQKTMVFPVYHGNSLVGEICAIRQAYLANGGTDPVVLSQMSQMQADAQTIEDQMKQQQQEPRNREKPKDNNHAQFNVLEMDNERLKRELMLLQEQNLLAQQRKKSDKEDELERELRRLQRDHLQKMYGLQKDLDNLRTLLMMERNRPQQQPAVQQPQPPVSLWAAQTPWLLQKPYVEVDPMAPYDQYAGFVIFYDFILSLDPTVQACRLVVGLHSSSAVMGEPAVLPTVYTEPATRAENYNYNYSNAVIGAKQPVPKCPPESDLGIVVELQASGGPASEHDRHSLITRAWTKLPLFDNNSRLISGRFRIAMRNVPIKPFMHVSQVQRITNYGDAELYYRIVDMRNAEVHSMQQVSAANYNQYSYPQWVTEGFAPAVTPLHHIPAIEPVILQPAIIQQAQHTPFAPVQPPPSYVPQPVASALYVAPVIQPKIKPLISVRQATPENHLPLIPHGPSPSRSPPQILGLQDMTLGFQVDRVKHAEMGEGKVRLTAYYASTGKVVQSATSAVTCSTTAVRSNFKHNYHIFGQQEAMFQEVEVQGDMVLIARFFLKRRQHADPDDSPMPDQQDSVLFQDETLVAWAALPLVNTDKSLSMKKRKNFNPNTMHINQGTHTIPMYQPPVPDTSHMLDGHPTRNWMKYGKSTLRVYIFQGQPRPGSLTPSDISDMEDEDTLPEYAWLPFERKIPPKDPFLVGDGFDVYIDGCRFLPDSVTFSKVAGRILDRRYEVAGPDINTGIKLDSDVYNPVYEEKFEFREKNVPPTATLLLKVYTIDNFYKNLTVVGYATLNIFVESGTERQPVVDKPMQVTLNEGSHQLRLYAMGPNGVDPMSESCLRDSGVRIVPCASILVTLVKVTRASNGKALESSKIPKSDWLRLGLWQPRPKYSDRVYYSTKCMPSRGETRLFHSMMRRTRRSVREVVSLETTVKDTRNDKSMDEHIKAQLTKSTDAKPLDQDLNFICRYHPKSGIKIAVDSAVNLPWTNFTLAHMCLNPPAAFYNGAPHATYDKLIFTEHIDLQSTNTSPAWKDGFKHFPQRSYHRFLTMIIHLQEISVSVARENYKYGLLEQAWTAVQVFTDRYANTQAFQLPLFEGCPSQSMLKQLAREPCKEWMERNIRNYTIQLLEGSSIFVRVADARRDDELVSDIGHNKLVEVITDYIPNGLEESYSRERAGKTLDQLVPQGKTPEQFTDTLSIKFKSLVYKLYEEGNVGT